MTPLRISQPDGRNTEPATEAIAVGEQLGIKLEATVDACGVSE